MSSHKNSVKSIIFLVVVKKGGAFLRPIKKKVFMVAEAPKMVLPQVFYYIMILVCIFLYHIFLKQWFFFGNIVAWFGFEPKSMPCY